jgi:hypothetical protein
MFEKQKISKLKTKEERVNSKLVLLFALFFIFVLFCASFGQVPHLINYQGMLTDDGGDPLNGTYDLTFSIYSVSSGGSAIWIEAHSGVEVGDGLFNVVLGSETTGGIPSSVFDAEERYLGIKVGAEDELTPRVQLTSVGYAYRAERVDTADYSFQAQSADTAAYALAGGEGDNDWAFRITDTADTTLVTGGPWGISRSGNILYGNADSTHVNLGVACTTGFGGQNRKYCTTGGGLQNTASGNQSTVGGGSYNTASDLQSTVSGGYANLSSGESATIGGGWHNLASGDVATVAGGQQDTASGDFATVGGGVGNVASGNRAAVVGGTGNIANGAWAFVGAGIHNNASGDYATIGGGGGNTASNFYATVGGGEDNTASASTATIGGGDSNTADSNYATVGGGRDNTASGRHATIGGGGENTASNDYATVAGGDENTASGSDATVGGGDYNHAIGDFAIVGGGGNNRAIGYHATIGGGLHNTASGDYATVPGGYRDSVAGDYSMAAGSEVEILADGDYTFAFGRNFTTATPNAVIFWHPDSATRMGVNVTNPTYAITLPNIANNSGKGYGNAWIDASSIRWKENISQIENPLDKIMALRGVYFDWKKNKKHDMGMIAEEVGEVVPEVVDFEENGIDAQGLSYARLTALLVEAMKEQQKEIESLREEINALKQGNR